MRGQDLTRSYFDHPQSWPLTPGRELQLFNHPAETPPTTTHLRTSHTRAAARNSPPPAARRRPSRVRQAAERSRGAQHYHLKVRHPEQHYDGDGAARHPCSQTLSEHSCPSLPRPRLGTRQWRRRGRGRWLPRPTKRLTKGSRRSR